MFCEMINFDRECVLVDVFIYNEIDFERNIVECFWLLYDNI